MTATRLVVSCIDALLQGAARAPYARVGDRVRRRAAAPEIVARCRGRAPTSAACADPGAVAARCREPPQGVLTTRSQRARGGSASTTVASEPSATVATWSSLESGLPQFTAAVPAVANQAEVRARPAPAATGAQRGLVGFADREERGARGGQLAARRDPALHEGGARSRSRCPSPRRSSASRGRARGPAPGNRAERQHRGLDADLLRAAARLGQAEVVQALSRPRGGTAASTRFSPVALRGERAPSARRAGSTSSTLERRRRRGRAGR